MKKVIIAAAFIFASAVSFAQTSSDVANLKVTMADVKTIEVLTKNVVINIATGDDYANAAGTTGVSTTTASQAAHLKVVSRGGFKVMVTASTPLTGQGGAAGSTISNNNVYISVMGHTALGGATIGATELAGLNETTNHNLGTGALVPLITTTALGGTVGTTFDVKYTLKGVTNIANLPAGDYTTVVTYTIAAL